jgi:hypothetical protein
VERAARWLRHALAERRRAHPPCSRALLRTPTDCSPSVTMLVLQDDCGNVVFRHLQLVLRQCGCVALRRTAEIERTRVAVYGGPMAPDALNDWLDRLVRGEIPLAPLLES